MKKRSALSPLALLFVASISQADISFPLNSDNCLMVSGEEKATFTGYEFLTEHSGRPKVPGFTYTFLLPPDADLATVDVSVENENISEVSSRGTVELGIGYSTSSKSSFPNSESYAAKRSGYYPESFTRVLTTGRIGNCKVVTCRFTPFQQDTTTKAFRKLNSGTMKLTYNTGESLPSNTVLPWKVKELKRITENYNEMIGSYVIPESKAAKPHMAILTSNATVSGSSSLERYIKSKENNGFKISLITEDQWGGSSWDKADDIRSWLQNNYEEKEIEYLLLIGDPTPNSGDVPMKMTLPMATPIGNDCPTDFYYAELTGNWDLNGNAWSGEGGLDLGVGGCEHYSEVVVGRIPVYSNDYATLDKILEKTIAYTEADSSTISWRENALLPVEPSDFMTPAYQFCEAIKNDFLDPIGWGSFRIYAESYGDIVPDLQPTSIENVTKSWQENPYGICVWKTHGNEDLAKKIMDSESAKLLNDEYPTLVFQGSCLNGKPEDPNNLGYALLKNGAIATIASSRLSLYKMGQTDPKDIKMTNLGMCYYFGKFMIEDKESIGVALSRLKTEIDGDFNGLWLNYCDYAVYGDPTVSLMSRKGHNVSTVAEGVSSSFQMVQNKSKMSLAVPGVNLQKASVSVVNLKGQFVHKGALSVTGDRAVWDMRSLSLAKGVYILSFTLTDKSGIEHCVTKRVTEL